MSELQKISKEDLDKLHQLFNDAQDTPVLKLSSDTPDLSSMAYQRLQNFQKELGKKYNYDWTKKAINNKGEIIEFD